MAGVSALPLIIIFSLILGAGYFLLKGDIDLSSLFQDKSKNHWKNTRLNRFLKILHRPSSYKDHNNGFPRRHFRCVVQISFFMVHLYYMKIHHYTAIFQNEPEGGYTVVIPALKGCVTYGETIEKAVLADPI